MSMTPVPMSILLVLTPIAVSRGNGDDSCRAKWWTRTNAPSMPSSSAATASSTVWLRASAAVCVCPPAGCHAPNERKPTFFGCAMSPVTYLIEQVFRGLQHTQRFPGTIPPRDRMAAAHLELHVPGRAGDEARLFASARDEQRLRRPIDAITAAGAAALLAVLAWWA